MAKAIQLSRKARETDPESFPANYRLFWCLEQLVNQSKAEVDGENRELRAFILEHSRGVSDRSRARAHALRGQARESLSAKEPAQVDTGISLINEAIDLDQVIAGYMRETKAELVVHKGSLLLAKGDEDAAHRHLLQALLFELAEDMLKRIDPLLPRIGAALEAAGRFVDWVRSVKPFPLELSEIGTALAAPPSASALPRALALVCGSERSVPLDEGKTDGWAPGRRARTAALVRLGADLGKTQVLHLLVNRCDSQAFDLALALGADVNQGCTVNGDRTTPLLSAAATPGRAAFLERLLSAGAEVKVSDGTALHEAAAHGDARNVEVLVQHVPVNTPLKHNFMPLHEAAYWGNAETARALLAHGADVSAVAEGQGSALEIARRRSRFDVVKLLSKKAGTAAPAMSRGELVELARGYGEQAGSGDDDPKTPILEHIELHWEDYYGPLCEKAISALPPGERKKISKPCALIDDMRIAFERGYRKAR